MASAKGWQRILVAVFGLLPALLLCVVFVPAVNSYPETYRSTFAARFADLDVSEANFCCPSVGAAEITL